MTVRRGGKPKGLRHGFLRVDDAVAVNRVNAHAAASAAALGSRPGCCKVQSRCAFYSHLFRNLRCDGMEVGKRLTNGRMPTRVPPGSRDVHRVACGQTPLSKSAGRDALGLAIFSATTLVDMAIPRENLAGREQRMGKCSPSSNMICRREGRASAHGPWRIRRPVVATRRGVGFDAWSEGTR